MASCFPKSFGKFVFTPPLARDVTASGRGGEGGVAGIGIEKEGGITGRLSLVVVPRGVSNDNTEVEEVMSVELVVELSEEVLTSAVVTVVDEIEAVEVR